MGLSQVDFEKLIENITPDVYEALKRAIEIGKWPDGRVLTDDQRSLCMEAVIVYDQRFVEEQQRVGFIDRGSKSAGETCDAPAAGSPDQEAPLKWR